MDKKEVEKIAALARLEFSEHEKENIPDQLIKILDYIDQLKELDTSNVLPIGQPLGALMGELKMADDEIDEFKHTEKLTGIAPDFKDGFYRVKKIIE